MNESNLNEEGLISKSHDMVFTHKPLHKHIIDFLKLYPKQIPKIVTMLISGWAILEILIQSQSIIIEELLFPLIILIGLISFVVNLREYNSNLPESLKNQPKRIQKFYIWQKTGWQYKMACDLLNNIVAVKTFEIERLKNGAEYVFPNVVSEEEYIIFLKTHPEGLARLVNAANITCTQNLPSVISKASSGKDTDVAEMMNEIEHFLSLYSELLVFEKRVYGIIPPEMYEVLHKYIFNWTDPILDGLNQFVKNLEIFAKITRRDLRKNRASVPESNITFEAHINIEKFNELLEKIQSSTK